MNDLKKVPANSEELAQFPPQVLRAISSAAESMKLLSERIEKQATAIDALAEAIDEMTGLMAQVISDATDDAAQERDAPAAPTSLDG